MKKVSDGWHTVKGFEVYIENGRVIRGILSGRTAYPYKETKAGYELGKPLVDTFRNHNWTLK